MERRKLLSGALAVAGAAVVGLAGVQAHAGSGQHGARTSLTLLVGAAPGGGWDTVAREMQQAMREQGIVVNPQVVNVPGAAGTIALTQLVDMTGRDDVLMVTGTVMIGGIVVNQADHDLTETTAIARLADDYEAVVVPADSPYQSVDDLVAAWRESPRGVAFGGGSLGGTDHLLGGLMAQSADIDPTQLNYLAFAGGGEAVNALLSNSIDVGISGYNEFADQVTAGNLRVLAISADERVEGIDAPTLAEQGYDVVLPNWRGVVAPPGIDAESRAELEAIVAETVDTPEWQSALERNRWESTATYGDDFTGFIDEETTRLTGVVEEIGL